jgi:hypothetical protein
MFATTEFLKTLKAGDEVAVANSTGSGYSYSIERVERVTNTLIMVDRKRFRRTTGTQTGESYHRAWLVEATPELKAEIAEAKKRRILINKIESVKWRQVETSVLEQVDALLQRDSASSGDNNVTQESVLSSST